MISSLARSCHPLPTVGVTLLTAGLARVAALPLGVGVLLVLAVFVGQLSIGWSNDALDAVRDRAVGRTDKPVAAGQISARITGTAAGLALVAAVVLSLLLGWRAALAALTLVAAGWAYNLGLKATPLSWLPYAIGFGTLPAAATLAGDPPELPAAWAWVAGALLGVAAHLANVLPDLTGDLRTGVRGLPHRLGARPSAALVPVLLFVATVVIVAAPGASRSLPAWRWWALVPIGLVAVVAAVSGWRRPTGAALLRLTLVVAAADLLLFGLSGGALT